MDEAIGYLVAAVVVLYILVMIIGAVLTIGAVLLAVVAAAGALMGLFIAARNFFQVLSRAHSVVPR